MRQEELVLREFVHELFPGKDDTVLQVLDKIVSLEKGDPKEDEETRKVTITEDKDSTVTAKSIKPYNLMRMSFHDLTGLLLRGTALPLFEDTKLKIAYGVLSLIHEFYPKISYSFNEQDSRLLLVILELGRSEFTQIELAEADRARYGEEIDEEKIHRSLNVLEQIKVIKDIGEGKFVVREKMIYERK